MTKRPEMDVPLYHGGVVVATSIVDGDTFDAVARYRWRLHKDGYAVRSIERSGRTRSIYLHRQVLGLGLGDELQVDHINRDRLDNRKANLRLVTNAENCQNHSGKAGGTSVYRGVYWDAARKRWMARVKLNYRHHFLGRYTTEIEAGRAAEAFRRAHLPHSTADERLGQPGPCTCTLCETPWEPRQAA